MEGKLAKISDDLGGAASSLGQQEEEKIADFNINFGEMQRLPNVAPSIQLPGQRDGYASPTTILESIKKPILENFRTASESIFMEYEGEMMRKTPEGKFKRYWFCLLGKELYCYRKKDDEKHKGMNSLVGIYIKSDEPEVINHKGKDIAFYSFRLIFPPNKTRVFYLITQSQRDKWVAVIKEAIGYACMEDFYEIKGLLGKGKFGQVRQAIHKKTQTSVAIKVIEKKGMQTHELELQKREIEVLKIC